MGLLTGTGKVLLEDLLRICLRLLPQNAGKCRPESEKLPLLNVDRRKKLFRLLAGASVRRTVDRDCLFGHFFALADRDDSADRDGFGTVRDGSR
jgi:hypothetical protein